MKSITIILIAALLGSNSVLAQKKEIPVSVKNAFVKKYPAATSVHWEKEHGRYETFFLLNGTEMSVLYNANGTVAETETKIVVDALPANAKKYALAKGKIKEAAPIVTANGKVKYEAEVNGADLLFDENGNFLEEKSERD